MRRIPEFDALRGLAVVVVLLFHLDPLRYYPGWSGVDLFFVLSGYLITGIILANAGMGSFGEIRSFYGRFFARRALRIWPIYYLTLIGLIVADRFLPEPPSERWFRAASVFLQYTSLYVGIRPLELHPAFGQTWTLALEEQFYLVWPLVAILAWRSGRFHGICGLVIAVNLALRSRENGLLPNNLGERLLVTRSDGFALGALLAASLRPGGWADGRTGRARWAFGGGAAVGSFYLGWGAWRHGGLGFIGLPTPSWPAETILMFSVLYAGVIGLVAVDSGRWWLAPLRLGPLVALGRISYGLYLLHPVAYWAVDGCGIPPRGPAMRYGQPWTTQALKLGLSVGAATASWWLVERPFLRWKGRFGYRPGSPTSRETV